MPEPFSVSQLLESVDAALQVCFPDEVWVEGEIAALKPMLLEPGNAKGPRHIFFDLVDPDTGGQPGLSRPVLPVKLFDSQRQRVNAYLRRYDAAGIKMIEGVRVRISGRLQLYPARSQVELRMNLLDPAYTLAQLASERDRVLRALAAEGLLARNAALSLARVPLSVGVVTSSGSAAAADFLHELELSGIGWKVSLVHSRVQGAGAERSLAFAVAELAERAVDVIAIVRGGGARTELSTFDAEALARAIAICPVPVVTGIGHEIDESVADRVAHSTFKTPTACAAFLVQRVRDYLEDVSRLRSGIALAAERACVTTSHRLERAAGAVIADSRTHLSAARGELGQSTTRLRRAGGRVTTSHGATLDHLGARVRALDPARSLARGWSITKTNDGRIVRSVDDVAVGSSLVTAVLDGSVASVVTGTAKSEAANDDRQGGHGRG